jgi:hypothetical protein
MQYAIVNLFEKSWLFCVASREPTGGERQEGQPDMVTR